MFYHGPFALYSVGAVELCQPHSSCIGSPPPPHACRGGNATSSVAESEAHVSSYLNNTACVLCSGSLWCLTLHFYFGTTQCVGSGAYGSSPLWQPPVQAGWLLPRCRYHVPVRSSCYGCGDASHPDGPSVDQRGGVLQLCLGAHSL
jgi:hypothetical protein